MQYFKFDADGTMYLYEPGSGMEGNCHKVVGPLAGNGATFDMDIACTPQPESSLPEMSPSFNCTPPWLNNYKEENCLSDVVSTWKYVSLPSASVHKLLPNNGIETASQLPSSRIRFVIEMYSIFHIT